MAFPFRFLGRIGLCLALIALVAGCSNPQDRYAAYMKRGHAYYTARDYPRARIEYRNALKLNPADPESRYRIALVDEAEGDIRSAFANYTLAAQQDPHFAAPRLKLAQYYLTADHVEDARKQIASVLAETPDLPEARALNGALLLREEKWDDAEREARFALSKDSANVSAFAVLIGLDIARKDLAKAATDAETAVRTTPNDVSLALLRASVYERMGDLDKTADAYRAVFRLAPQDSGYRAALAAIYVKAGQIDRAEAVLRDAVKDLPQDMEIKRQLLRFLDQHRGIAAADAEAHAMAKADPDRPEPSIWLADLYMAHNDHARAIATLQEGIDHQAAHAPGLNARAMLAMIHLRDGDKPLAASLAKAVLENDPDNKEALYIQAALDFDQGRDAAIVTAMRGVLTRDPTFVAGALLLAESLARQGHADLAIDTLHQLLDAVPDAAPARIRMAQLHAQSGNTTQAMAVLTAFTRDHPDAAIAWESLARVALAAKDWASAQTAIDRLGALPGQSLTAAYLTGQVLAATGQTENAIRHDKAVLEAARGTPLADHALRSLVEHEGKLGRLDEAVRVMEGLDLANPFVAAMLGETYMRLNRPIEAADALDRALRGGIGEQTPYLQRAMLYQKENKADQAIDILKKADAAMPGDPRAALMEASLEETRGDFDAAIKRYDALLMRFPALDAAANNLAMLYADHRANDADSMNKARALAERFLASPNPMLLDTLAWVYDRQGDSVRAYAIVRKINDLTDNAAPQDPQAAYHQAAILMKNNQPDAARAALAKAVQAAAPYPGLDDAKAMAKTLGAQP